MSLMGSKVELRKGRAYLHLAQTVDRTSLSLSSAAGHLLICISWEGKSHQMDFVRSACLMLATVPISLPRHGLRFPLLADQSPHRFQDQELLPKMSRWNWSRLTYQPRSRLSSTNSIFTIRLKNGTPCFPSIELHTNIYQRSLLSVDVYTGPCPIPA